MSGISGLGTQRPLIVQQFRTFSFAVGVAPALPLDPTTDKSKLITTVMISNPIGGNSVFFGNQGVLTTTGLEIPGGTTAVFSIDQGGRQIYEIQGPLLDINSAIRCIPKPMDGLPFVVWDPSTIFLVAGAAQTVSVAFFPSMFI